MGTYMELLGEAEILHQKRKHFEAIKKFELALRKAHNPSQKSAILRKIGDCYTTLGLTKDAYLCYQRALAEAGLTTPMDKPARDKAIELASSVK